MDKTVDSGSTDMGSIPIRDAKTLKDTWIGFYINPPCL